MRCEHPLVRKFRAAREPPLATTKGVALSRRNRRALGRQEESPDVSVGSWITCTEVESWGTMVEVGTTGQLAAAAAAAGVETAENSREQILREMHR